MTAACQNCTAPSPDAFLCQRCQRELKRMLDDCPWWISRLAESAVGDTRMSDGGGHSAYDTRYPINGEHNVAHYLATFPGESDELPDDKAMARRYESARREILAAGGVNERASVLMDEIGNTLSTIVRGLIESRGAVLPPSLTQGARTGAAACTGMAKWLSGQLSAISADESAGQTYAEIHALVGDERRDGRIGRVINRPVPRKYLGKCPTWLDKEQRACQAQLYAPGDAIEFRCRACRMTHNCDRLQLLMMNDLERETMTVDEILAHNRWQPEEYRIKERTLRQWRTPGPDGEPKLKPCGYSDKGEPLYRWPDVRKLREAKPQKVTTGAAAHRRMG